MKVKADVTNYNEVAQMIEAGLERMGKIDVLVNVAGGVHDGLWITEMSEENWDYVVNVNLKSAFNCIKAIVPHFLARQTGKIINVSSLAKDGVPWFAQAGIGRSSYATANAGLIGLTRTLAYELGKDGITVNCVVPGPVQTPNTEKGLIGRVENDPKVSCSPLRMIPLGRLATPEDVAGGIYFLASDDANYISGHSLYITGGL
jgi:3-oxoacyl-[acyl-carrier protein] reductase